MYFKNWYLTFGLLSVTITTLLCNSQFFFTWWTGTLAPQHAQNAHCVFMAKWRQEHTTVLEYVYIACLVSVLGMEDVEESCDVYKGVSKIFRTDIVKLINLTAKRVWKLPTSVQLRATWHIDLLDMVVLPSTSASRYHS
jgi:hypothetical protein